MKSKNFTFIIPAAGRSSRFKFKESKIFFKYKKKYLIEHVLDKCIKFSDKIIIVTSKNNELKLKSFLKKKKLAGVKIVIQKKPLGMGHAVSLALKRVQTRFSAVIWSDQIYLNIKTISKSLNSFLKSKSLLTFPIVKKNKPYVKILLNNRNQFLDIIQSRETNKILKVGFTDCGFFIFKTKLIREELSKLIINKKILTRKTKEIDFLKSFKYFKLIGNIELIKSNFLKDTIGINKKDDLI